MASAMTDLDALAPATPNVATPKPCRKHIWTVVTNEHPTSHCVVCRRPFDRDASRLGKNNRKRGNSAELDVARLLGGEKVGPLGLPWDVEVPGYARLQVKKLATPPSLRYVAAQLARIPDGPELAGFVWIEPGRGGEQLITFRLRPFSQWHGLPSMEEER